MFTGARAEVVERLGDPALPEGRGAPGVPLDPARLRRAKRAYVTRHVELTQAVRLLPAPDPRPRAGDLLLARLLELGHHRRLELPCGRKARLFAGDELVLAFGARYASDQFEAAVPEDLAPCELIAAGGLAGRCLRRHDRTRRPTRIAPIGLLADAEGRPLSLRRFAPLGETGAGKPAAVPFTVAVVGTGMNAGKTTTAAALVRGYRRLGRRVAAVKATGTGSGGDRFALLDAGAQPVYDFTDLGLPSTCGLGGDELEEVFLRLWHAAAAAGAERLVVEVADGLLFKDTAALLQGEPFRRRVDAVVLAAGDSMGAVGAVRWLEAAGLGPVLVSGRIACSPLAMEEAVRALGRPVETPETLASGLKLPQPVS